MALDVGIGEETVLLDIDHGNLTLHDALPPLATWYFSVRGSVQAWDGYWRDPPAAGWHDLFALVKCQEMRIEGNLHGLMANLQFFKDLLALPRTTS